MQQQIASSHSCIFLFALEFIILFSNGRPLTLIILSSVGLLVMMLLSFLYMLDTTKLLMVHEITLPYSLFPFLFWVSYCNDCRDLDLCRDPTLLTEEWHCGQPQCGQPYDREVMENALLQIARQRERQYHLQDLVCVRCNQVKAAHLAEQCACAGSFKCKEDATEFRKKMQVIFNIASRQKFQLLQECTSWMLELKI
jgi:hypothetical protein